MTRLVPISMLTLLLAGCGVRAPIEPRADPYLPKQIHMDSQRLRKDTAVGTPIVARDQSGLLVVTVPIRSAINKTLYVDYTVTFFDRNGNPIGNKLGPFTKTLDPNTPDSITVNSTSPQAADFQISFRYAR
ncbi:DUF1425 domain-containing protein [Fontivita pretiosa]|uniref:DUF1425 domain-containing protein n=1 Tax=Fontivita pretiosa TaxID=2989684 RepID=UPI003D184416